MLLIYLVKKLNILREVERFENNPKYNKLSEALIKFQDGEKENETSKILFYDRDNYNTGKIV